MVWPFTIPACVECNAVTGWARYTCPDCKRGGLCADCCDFPALTDNDKGTTVCFCKPCFKKHSTLDFSVDVDVMGPAQSSNRDPCILFVHGGGGCRTMFRAHAEAIVAKHNIRCVLLDLPGHGALMDVPLSVQSAVDRILEVASSHCNFGSTTYVGGSFGGYMGFEVMKRPEAENFFSNYVIACASQTVGVGAGWKARLGLVAMGSVPRRQMLSLLYKISKKAPNLMQPILLRDSMSPGMFFGQAKNQIESLKQTDIFPAARLQKRVLYMYGTADHHDAQDELVRLGGPNATAVGYDSDHFFTHDKRHFDDVVNRIIGAALAPA